MLRSLAKTGVAHLLWRTGADAHLGRWTGAAHRPLILGYHRVTPRVADTERWLPGMAISVSTLERQLDEVGRRYRFAPLEEVAAAFATDEDAGRGLAAVTFDDGYADVYENAFPLLQRKGIPWAIFVVTDLVGTEELLLHDRLYLGLLDGLCAAERARRVDAWVRQESAGDWAGIPTDPHEALTALLTSLSHGALKRLAQGLEHQRPLPAEARRELRLVDWEALREMSKAGVTVGSHTTRHALLPREDAVVIRQDLQRSRETLLAELGKDALHLAFPGGCYDGPSLAAVAEAGYRFAYTICAHRDASWPTLTIPRRMLWQGSCVDSARRFSEAVLSCQLNGVFDAATSCRNRHALRRADPPA